MYITLKDVGTKPFKQETQTNLGAIGGINLLSAPEFQGLNFAQRIDGYIIKQKGKIEAIKGVLSLYSTTDNEPIYFATKYDNDFIVFAHGRNLKGYRISTGDVNVITSLLEQGTTDMQGGVYANLLYTATGLEVGYSYPPGRILSVSGKSGNFDIGETITGSVSGATGVLDIDKTVGGSSGRLFISRIVGTFSTSDVVTGSTSGATANVDSVPNAYQRLPSEAIDGKAIFFFGGRMYLGKGSQVQWSQVDSGADKPFSTAGEWTVSGSPPTPESSNSAYAGNFGNINSFGVLGGQVVAFYDNGKAGFRIESIDAGTGLTQNVITDFEREDFGGERGAISTPYGIFYVNEGGLWQMLSGGNTNQPYSERDNEISQILGDDLIDSLDLTNSSIVYDIKRNLILFTAAENSNANNTLFIYNPVNQAFFKMPNVFANRFARIDKDIYIGSSAETNLLKLFEGSDNNGVNIFRTLEFEVPLGTDALYELNSTVIKGRKSADSNIKISYDIYDKFGVKQENFLQMQIGGDDVGTDVKGFGNAGFAGGFGGDVLDEMTEFRAERDTPINEFSRLIMRIESEDNALHEFTWISVDIALKSENDTNQNLTVL